MSLEEAVDEWEGVAEIVPTFRKTTDAARSVPAAAAQTPAEKPLLTHAAAERHLRSTAQNDRPTSQEALTRVRPSSWWTSCLPCMKRDPDADMVDGMRWASALTRVPFDDEDPAHFQILLTLYKQYTGDRVDCPRYGSHWEQVGFQGNDPATDLRGVGLLGLLQALYVVTTPELVPLARRVHRVSRTEPQDFPLMVLSINLTRIAFDCFMEGRLQSLFGPADPTSGILSFPSSADRVSETFNLFFAGTLFLYYQLWVGGHKTILDSGYVLKEVEARCKSKPLCVVEDLRRHLCSSSSNPTCGKEEVDAARRELQKRSA